MTIDDESRQSSHSFSVGFSATAGRLSDAELAQVMKALTDPTPGLRSILPRVLRDEEIRRLAQTMSASGAAARIASELRRYLSAGWTIDREQGAPVDASELRRSLFRIATFNAGADLTERQIRTIIAA